MSPHALVHDPVDALSYRWDLDGDGDLDGFIANWNTVPNQFLWNQGGVQNGTEGVFIAAVYRKRDHLVGRAAGRACTADRDTPEFNALAHEVREALADGHAH